MVLMTTQPIFTFAPTGQGTPLGVATHLVETEDGRQVFIHGLLTHAWEPGDEVARRFAAAFGIALVTLWQWKSAVSTQGIAGLISEKRGPNPVKLSATLRADVTEPNGSQLMKVNKNSCLKVAGAELYLSKLLRSTMVKVTWDPEELKVVSMEGELITKFGFPFPD